MLDAEIAAILLNRREPDDQAAADLLREGNLHFIVEKGGLGPVAAAGCAPLRIECLLFADGSRAFRVGSDGADLHWSRWSVVEPFQHAAAIADAIMEQARSADAARWARG